MSPEELRQWMLIIAGLAFVSLLSWRFRRDPETHGSADWMKIWRAVFKGLFKNDGILIGDWIVRMNWPRPWNLPIFLPIFYRHDGHCITIAPAGSGKGTAAIIPNLFRQEWIFLMDPGGENTAVVAGYWQEKGYSFYCINPWKMHGTKPWKLPNHSLNPLDILDPDQREFHERRGRAGRCPDYALWPGGWQFRVL